MNQSAHNAVAGGVQEKLLEGMKAALAEAEDLLRSAASATGDQAAELRARALDSLRATRESLHDTQESILRQGKKSFAKRMTTCTINLGKPLQQLVL